MGKIIASPQGEGFVANMNGILYGFSKNFFTNDFLTLGLNEMSRDLNVKDAFDTFNKLQQEQNISAEDARSQMPEEQIALLDTYQLMLNLQAGSEANFGTTLGEGLKEMIPFIAQFAATSGIGTGAKSAVREFIEARTKSAIKGRIAGAIAKPLAQAPAMVPAVLQNYAQRVAPTTDETGQLVEGENPLQAAYKAYLSTVAEVAGEDVGVLLNKWGNKAARQNFMKLIANKPDKAQQFLGKLSLALTRETNVPGIQNFLFEGLGEEATGLMQAAIDQNGAFFTPEAQAQIWALSFMASGSFATLSIPNRIKVRSQYNRATSVLNDIPNAEYVEAVQSISQNYADPEDLISALDDISPDFEISMEDYLKARLFLGNSVAFNQMNTARALQIEQQIAQSVGADGNVTLTVHDGIPYSVRNPQDLGKESAAIYLRANDGTVKTVISSRITEWETKEPGQIVGEQMQAQDETDLLAQQQQEAVESAEARGLVPGVTVEAPQGKLQLISINPDGTATIQNPKGEQFNVNTTELEPYQTKRQQEEEKEARDKQKEADAVLLEGIAPGAEIVADEPLFEGSDIRIIDFSNGQSKISTPEGIQIVNSKEERDATVGELAKSQMQAAEEVDIDTLPPEEAFKITYEDDPEIAMEILRDQISSFQGQADQARTAAKATNVVSEKRNFLKQAKELEAQVASLNDILANPDAFVTPPVEEEAPAPEVAPEEVIPPVAEEAPVEETEEQRVFNQADNLYNEFLQEEANTPFNQLEPWQQALLGSRITQSSFERFGDPNAVTSGMARGWFVSPAQAGASNTIDVMAEEISEETGQNVTPEMIVDFITSNPTNTVRKTTNRMNEIRNEYKNVTGQSINQHNALRDRLGLEPAPAIETAEDVVDDPLAVAETPEGEVPFRAEMEDVSISESAREKIQHKTNALKALNEMQNRFGVPINIINAAEMSDAAKKRAEALKVIPPAYYENGEVYLISERMRSVSDVKRSYMHEAVLHKGLDLLFNTGPVDILGKTFNTKQELLDEVFNRLDEQSIGERASIYGKNVFDQLFEEVDGKIRLKPGATYDLLTDAQKRELAEEAMATASETESPRLQALLDKLWNFIKRTFGFTSAQFSKADFRNMLREHQELIIRQKEDAEAIRRDERQVPEARPLRKGSPTKSGEDLQRETEARIKTRKPNEIRFRTEDGQSFEQWRGNNEYIQDYQISEVKTGEPVVVRAYHGTTHPFYEFKGGELGNVEGHLGATNYFTSEYGDAQQNYGATGADLTGRIEQRADELNYDIEDLTIDDTFDYESISDQFNINIDEIQDLDTSYDIAKIIAEKELMGAEEQVLDLYLKLNNPLVLGADPVYVEAIDESYIDDYMDEAYESIAEEYEIDEAEARADYEAEARDKARELAEEAYVEPENKLDDAFQRALQANGIEARSLNEFVEIYDPEVDLNQLEKDLRNSEEFSFLENNEGQIVNSQVLSDFFEELGYDGVILTDVNERFPGMNLYEGVSHIHIPDQYNNQIKLADGTNVSYDPETSDIRFRTEDYQSEHTAPYKNDSDMPMNDLMDIYGDDIYSNRAANYFGDGVPYDNESIQVIQDVRDNPDAMVTIYRSVPSGIKDATINSGDWVSTSRKYAEDHGRSNLGNDYQVLETTVRADELFTDGNSIHEWGYDSKADQETRDADEVRFRVADSQQELDDFVKDSEVKETVYHGTDFDFDEFDPTAIGSTTDPGMWGSGFYFAPDRRMSEVYGKNIMKVKLNLKNPYIVRQASKVPRELRVPHGFTKKDSDTLRDKFIEMGHDGVLHYSTGDKPVLSQIVVFNPENILVEEVEKPDEDVRFRVDEQREQVETDPSEAQKEAGNYKMGHVKFDGFDISIENPAGSIRSGKDEKGEEWSAIMPADYGYFKGTVGKDKDHIDVYMGDNLDSDNVYVVDQVNEDGSFDEHKVMMGYNSLAEARNAYMDAYEEGWQGLGNITKTTKDGLKQWFKDGDTKKPFAEEDVKFRAEAEDPEVQKILDRLQEMQETGVVAARVAGLEEQAESAFELERNYIMDQLKALKEGAKLGAEETTAMISEVQKVIADYAKKHLPLTEAGAREVGSLLTLLRNAKTPQAVEKAFKRIDELAGVTEKRTDLRKHVGKVNRLLKWMTGLKKVGAARVGKFNYQDTESFQRLGELEKQVKSLVKMSNARNATAEEKMDAEARLDELWNELNETPNKTPLDNASMKLIELRRLGAKASPKLAQLLSEELESIYKIAKETKSEADLQKALARREDKDEVTEYLERDKNVEDLNWFKKAMRQINTGTADIMGNWETILTMIGGTELRDKYSLLVPESQVEVGTQETMNNVLDAAKKAYGKKTQVATQNEITNLSAENYQLRQPNRRGEEGKGTPKRLSKLHLMDIYNAIKNPDVMNDYYMAYGDITLKEDGSRDADAQRDSGELVINELLDNLSDQDKSFADAMQLELDKYYDSMNEVYIKLYNRDLPRVENYWPSTAEREQDIDVMQQMFIESRHPGATKERAAHRIPEPRDAFAKFANHVKEAEWYTNMALPIDRVNRIFKDKNIEALINDKRGRTFYKNINEAIANVGLTPPAKVQQTSKLNEILDPLVSNWVVGKIGASPSVAFKQLLSVVNYAENMPAEQWAAGFMKGLTNPAQTWKEMMQIPYLKTRLGSGYSEAVQRALQSDANIHRSKISNMHQAYKRMATMNTRYGDITAIIFGGKPYIDYLVKQGMSEKEAIDKFIQDTLRSQQSPFASSLSKLQNARNPFLRAMFMFSNTPSQYMRKLFEANQNLRVQKQKFNAGELSKEEYNKAKKQTAKAHTIYGAINTAAFVMAGELMNAILKGASWDDELVEKMMIQLGSTYTGGLPILKDILGTASRQALGQKVYDDVNPYVESLNGIIDVGIKLSKGEVAEDKKAKAYDNIARGLGDLTAVPYDNIKKMVKAVPPLREETVKATRIKETDNKLKKFSKSDFAPKADAAVDLKKAYSRAKSRATRLKKEGDPITAQKITDLIDRSKVHLWDTKYSASDMRNELKQFIKMEKKIK